MGYAIIKCERDADLYVLWSSVTESCAGVGTRSEIVDWFTAEYGRAGMDNWLRALDRADEFGTSDSAFGTGAWDDSDDDRDRIRVMETAPPLPEGPHGAWYIPRNDLFQYAHTILDGEQEHGWALMVFETYDDDDDD